MIHSSAHCDGSGNTGHGLGNKYVAANSTGSELSLTQGAPSPNGPTATYGKTVIIAGANRDNSREAGNLNRRRPVAISCRTTPSEKMSD